MAHFGARNRDLVSFAPHLPNGSTMTFRVGCGLISQNVLIKLFSKSQFPHKSVNLSFIITSMKNKFTDLCGN